MRGLSVAMLLIAVEMVALFGLAFVVVGNWGRW